MPLQYFQEIKSTNNYIRENLKEFKKNFSGVYSFNQSKGKGQRGSVWVSEPNKNIALTFCLSENSLPNNETLSFWVALIVCDFIEEEIDLETVIKWPNDILVNKKKVSGILIEKIEKTFLIGIGINVLQEKFESLTKASSLYLISPKKYSLSDLVKNLILRFKESLINVDNQLIIRQYNSKLFGRNKVMAFRIKGIIKNGIIQKVDKDGLLWVELEDEGMRKFRIKEIEFLY